MIKIVIAGFNGKMGKATTQMVLNDARFQLVGVVSRHKDVSNLNEMVEYPSIDVPVFSTKEEVVANVETDVWIDFTSPEGIYETLLFLIENDITVISIMTDKNLVEKTVSNIQEVITRGAKTLVVTNQNIDDKMFDTVIHIPETNSFISPILSVIPLQLLAYYISKEKGLDVDKPRNLAKSVTVE